MLVKCVVALLRHPALAGIMDPPGEEQAAAAAARGPQGGPGAAAAGPGAGAGRRTAPSALSRLTGNDPCTQLPGAVLRMLCAELREARCVCGLLGHRSARLRLWHMPLGFKGLCWWQKKEQGCMTICSGFRTPYAIKCSNF